MSADKKATVIEYVDIRIIATLLVIVGHGTKIVMTKKCGEFPTFEYGEISVYLEYFRQIIYSFHMPLFFMLSGSVFAVSFQNHTPQEWIRNRIKRLMIPYFVVAAFWLVPVRVFVNYYYQYKEPINSILFNDYLLSYDVNYLWFVLALTEISILMLPLKEVLFKKSLSVNCSMLCVLLFISAAQFLIPQLPFQISSALRFLFWFYLGACFELNRNNISSKLNMKHFYCFFVIWVLAFLMHTYFEHALAENLFADIEPLIKIIKMGVRYVMEFSGSMTVYTFALLKKPEPNRIARIIDHRSFHIYLLHCPFIYLIQYTYSIIFSGWNIMWAQYILLVIIQLCMALLLSVGLDYLLSYLKQRLLQ